MAAQAGAAANPDASHSAFSIRVRDLDVAYRQFAVFALPGEAVPIALDAADRFTMHAVAGTWLDGGHGRWTWRAPHKPGDYSIDIQRSDGAGMHLEAFVMVPASKVRNGVLNGYRIGRYPRHPRGGLEIYRAPPGFIEVTPQLAAVHVSPHFTLGEFLCKEAGGYPKYLVLRPRLLLKLEELLAYLGARGIPPGDVHIMSGYRTPWYNARLGNVEYSRHMWGDAADIYIASGDASQAAADQDGLDEYRNSGLLAADVDELFRKPANAWLKGGIGIYPATRNHPAFVHVDARGFNARW